MQWPRPVEDLGPAQTPRASKSSVNIRLKLKLRSFLFSTSSLSAGPVGKSIFPEMFPLLYGKSAPLAAKFSARSVFALLQLEMLKNSWLRLLLEDTRKLALSKYECPARALCDPG